MRPLVVALLLALPACAPSSDAPPDGVATPAADREAVRDSLMQALSHAPEQLEMRVHADGTQHLRITSGFAHHTVLVRNDAGVAQQCVSSLSEALRLVEGEAP